MDPEVIAKIKRIWKIAALFCGVILLIGAALLFGIAWYFDSEFAEWEAGEIAWYDQRKARAVPVSDGASLAAAMREFERSGAEGKFVGTLTLPGEQRSVYLEMNSYADREPLPAQLAAYEHLRTNYPELKNSILATAAEKHNELRKEVLARFEGVPDFLLRLFFRKSFIGDLEGRLPELSGAADFDRQDYEIWIIPTQRDKDGTAYVGLKFRSPWNMLFLHFIVIHNDEVFTSPPWVESVAEMRGTGHSRENIFEKLRQLQEAEQ